MKLEYKGRSPETFIDELYTLLEKYPGIKMEFLSTNIDEPVLVESTTHNVTNGELRT